MKTISLAFIAFSVAACHAATVSTKVERSSEPDWICAKEICVDDNSITTINPVAYVTVLVVNQQGRGKVNLESDASRFLAKNLYQADVVHLDINCLTKQIWSPKGYSPLPYRFGSEQLAQFVCHRAGLFKAQR